MPHSWAGLEAPTPHFCAGLEAPTPHSWTGLEAPSNPTYLSRTGGSNPTLLSRTGGSNPTLLSRTGGPNPTLLSRTGGSNPTLLSRPPATAHCWQLLKILFLAFRLIFTCFCSLSVLFSEFEFVRNRCPDFGPGASNFGYDSLRIWSTFEWSEEISEKFAFKTN